MSLGDLPTMGTIWLKSRPTNGILQNPIQIVWVQTLFKKHTMIMLVYFSIIIFEYLSEMVILSYITDHISIAISLKNNHK